MNEKTPRVYRSRLRDEQAAQTRLRILEAAATVFAARGYSAATMPAIATEAGVSTESVKAAGTKAELLVASFELAFTGTEGADSLADTLTGTGVIDLPADTFLPTLVDRIADANARGHGLWSVLVGAGLSDALVADALSRILGRRHQDFDRLVHELTARGAAPTDPAAAAAELSFTLSPEGYQQLVIQSGWTEDRYRAWIIERTTAIVGSTARR
ncbi:TetR/AcrR family transcriptional regulator [Microbacterium gorillae]|uniref:TetR/AcrR family transcriptional regulator n=1 Tax=Microbacterium gorillae TaxID=1231063 RepID=UPI00058D4D46|nr:TetR/AcrR family transcriptional regulator [Microbacterium gorillae]